MDEFDIENPLSLHREDEISSLFHLESDHIPSHNYSQILKTTSVRHDSIHFISHLCSDSSFAPFLSYLAITYLDRFLSAQGIPERKPWVSRILAVSCVSLALKMRKTELSAIDVQMQSSGGGGGEVVFDTDTIHRMELLILGVLKWRMRSITPFSFMNFFISLLKLKDPYLTETLKARANDIIIKAQLTDMNTLEFKPSSMAASALLSSCHELFPLHFSCFKNAISNCSYVDKDELYRCYDSVLEIAMEEYGCVMDDRSRTPLNVLDEQWWSFNSTANSDDMVTAVVGDDETESVDMKRRKTAGGARAGLGNEKSFRLSHHIQRF